MKKIPEDAILWPIRWWQDFVSSWANFVFAETNPDRTLKHLELEMIELRRAHDAKDAKNIEDECADILGILLHYADQQGVSLDQALSDKMEINLDREWLPPNEDGIMFHKKEEGDEGR